VRTIKYISNVGRVVLLMWEGHLRREKKCKCVSWKVDGRASIMKIGTEWYKLLMGIYLGFWMRKR
jgi:hypothetical protein